MNERWKIVMSAWKAKWLQIRLNLALRLLGAIWSYIIGLEGQRVSSHFSDSFPRRPKRANTAPDFDDRNHREGDLR